MVFVFCLVGVLVGASALEAISDAGTDVEAQADDAQELPLMRSEAPASPVLAPENSRKLLEEPGALVQLGTEEDGAEEGGLEEAGEGSDEALDEGEGKDKARWPHQMRSHGATAYRRRRTRRRSRRRVGDAQCDKLTDVTSCKLNQHCRWRQYGVCIGGTICKIDIDEHSFPSMSAEGEELEEQQANEREAVMHIKECGAVAGSDRTACNKCREVMRWSIDVIHHAGRYDLNEKEAFVKSIPDKIKPYCTRTLDEWCENFYAPPPTTTTMTTTTTQIYEGDEIGWECYLVPKEIRDAASWCSQTTFKDGWEYEWFADPTDTPCGCNCCKKWREGWAPTFKPMPHVLDRTTRPSCLSGTSALMGPSWKQVTPNSAISASSSRKFQPRTGIAGSRMDEDSTPPWCASTADHGQWIQVKFKQTMVLTKVLTLGRGDAKNEFVTQFKLVYKNLQGNWTAYDSELPGNTHGAVVQENVLIPIATQTVRIQPTQWNGGICLRFEFVGCNFYDITKQFGQEGHPGIPGGMGAPGPKGYTGIIGDTGPRGETGEGGVKGERGLKGPVGENSDPVDCVWAQWIEWTVCSVGCGDGYQQRERGYLVYPQDAGKDCHGKAVQTKKCVEKPCGGALYKSQQTSLKTGQQTSLDKEQDNDNQWEVITIAGVSTAVVVPILACLCIVGYCKWWRGKGEKEGAGEHGPGVTVVLNSGGRV